MGKNHRRSSSLALGFIAVAFAGLTVWTMGVPDAGCGGEAPEAPGENVRAESDAMRDSPIDSANRAKEVGVLVTAGGRCSAELLSQSLANSDDARPAPQKTSCALF